MASERRVATIKAHLNVPAWAINSEINSIAQIQTTSANETGTDPQPKASRSRADKRTIFIGPTSHYYISQRLRLHYVDWGNQDKPLLVLIHGGRDHCRSFDWLAKDLREDFHVIAPDLRGHGDSQWAVGGEYQQAEFALDLHQLLGVVNKFPVTIIGHSMGGFIAQLYSAMFPQNVKKLVLLDALGSPPATIQAWFKEPLWKRTKQWVESMQLLASRQPRRYKTIEEAASRMREENSFLSAEQANHLTVFGVSRNEDGTFSWKFDNQMRVMFPQVYSENIMKEQQARIACPVICIWGANSWQGDPALDGRLEPFKNIKTIRIEDAGHWVHHDKLDEVIAHTRAFLLG